MAALFTSPITPKQVATFANAGGVVRTAQDDMAGHRVVKSVDDTFVAYADPGTIMDAHLIIGLTIAAAVQGGEVDIQINEEIVDPSFSFELGPIFCGFQGALTQQPPTSDQGALWVRQVAVAVAPDRILVTGRSPVFLA